MATERRRTDRRCPSPGQFIDVTRLEHENLCGQIDEMFRAIRRLEAELQAQRERINVLEHSARAQRRWSASPEPSDGAVGQ